MKCILFIVFILFIHEYSILNVRSMRFSHRKKFLFKNKRELPMKKSKNKVYKKALMDDIYDYEIPKWVYGKVFKHNKNNIYNETKY